VLTARLGMRLNSGIGFAIRQPGSKFFITRRIGPQMRALLFRHKKAFVVWIGRIRKRNQIRASVSLLLHEELVAERTLPLPDRTLSSRQNSKGIVGSEDDFLAHFGQLLRSHLSYVDCFGRLGSVPPDLRHPVRISSKCTENK